MRTRVVFKQAYNAMLTSIADPLVQSLEGSEAALSQRFRVSRSTIRSALVALAEAGLLTGREVLRRPRQSDFFAGSETQAAREVVERRFLEWILHADIGPGRPVNVSHLARQFGISTTVIREYLHHMRHYGLLDRRPNSNWVFKGVTGAFAAELCDIREIFEIRSARRFATLDAASSVWNKLRALRAEHVVLLAEVEERFRDFSGLDERLHRLVYEVSENRFVEDFFHVISMIFHYHYQWNKVDEKARNKAAIGQHLEYIDALLSRDLEAIEQTCRNHLHAARETMMLSTGTASEKNAFKCSVLLSGENCR